jgi:molybdopterin-guanine dinucleotide biosynthesis protein A
MFQRFDDLTAIILAGGKSLRMGKDKAFLDWNGRLLIEQMVETLKPAVREVMVVAKNREKFYFLKATIHEDLVLASSPLVGIMTGLHYSSTDLNFIVACDMPFVSASVVERLYQATRDSDGVIPVSLLGSEPLCAIYRKRCRDTFQAHLQRGCPSVICALKDLSIKTLPSSEWSEEERRALFNMNTIEEYMRAQRGV